MSEKHEQNQTPIQEGQSVPKMQKIVPNNKLEKGQPVPPMEQKPQASQSNQNSDSSEAKE